MMKKTMHMAGSGSEHTAQDESSPSILVSVCEPCNHTGWVLQYMYAIGHITLTYGQQWGPWIEHEVSIQKHRILNVSSTMERNLGIDSYGLAVV